MRTQALFTLSQSVAGPKTPVTVKARAEGRRSEAKYIIDLDESNSKKRKEVGSQRYHSFGFFFFFFFLCLESNSKKIISKKQSRISKKRSREAEKKKKTKKGFKETVNGKLNGNASVSDSQAAKIQVNVLKYSNPSNENVNSPD
jgi:hypothetical protein